MKQAYQSLILMLAMISILLIDPLKLLSPNTLAAKTDQGGEVLNFAPTVDFELKEKKKVDVIVDVGTTAYTIDEVKSFVNQSLRPQLQEAGYDFKLQVEKSSEGDSKLYYYHPMRIAPYEALEGIYEYDVITGIKKKLPMHYAYNIYPLVPYSGASISNNSGNHYPFYYDPVNKYIVYRGQARGTSSSSGYDGDYFIQDVVNPPYQTYTGYLGAGGEMLDHFNHRSQRSFFAQDGHLYTIEWKQLYKHTIGRDDAGNLMITKKELVADHLPWYISSNDQNYYFSGDSIVAGPNYDFYYRLRYSYQGSWGLETNSQIHRTVLNGYTQSPITQFVYAFSNEKADSDTSTMLYVMPGRKTIIQGVMKHPGHVNLDYVTSSRVSSIEEYDTVTGKRKVLVTGNKDGYIRTNSHDMIGLSDDRLVYSWCYQDMTATITTTPPDEKCELRIIDDLDKPQSYRVLYQWFIPFDYNANPYSRYEKAPRLVGTVENKMMVVWGQGWNSTDKTLTLAMIDADNGAITKIDEVPANSYPYTHAHFLTFSYPEWYVSKKRDMTDIVDEVPYRSDAEKYYVRLDEQAISHMNASKNVVKTINAFSKQQINYIQIGNEKNRDKANQIQAALNQEQMHYDITKLHQSFNQIGTYITERKEVDLQVLVTQSGQTKTAIETSVTNLVQQLRAENIIVNPQYLYGTASSTLQGLYDRIQWNPDKNHYVLFLNTAVMNELQDEAYLEGAITTLASHYAHYMQIGSNSNRIIAEALIKGNESRGKFYNGTSYSSYYADMKQYIMDTALKHPKRMKDVLVLQHDPATNDYSAEININMYYDDYETDRKRNERFKTTQDPTVYENHAGLMAGIGQYLEAPTTTFTKVGRYEMTMQAQDEPLADPALSEYWKWSQDSLSLLRLYVHRAPVAKFSAIIKPNKSLTITDYSYDLDRYSRINHGIVEWEWKWKKLDDLSWTTGQLTQLASNTDYFISLRVKDIDGAWSNDYIQFVTSNPYNQPPVALFEIDPMSVSHRKNAAITDRSYDPDGDAIIKREWLVKKDGSTIWESASQPTKTQLQTAAANKGLNQLGSYEISLRVTDTLGELSEWHTEWLEVVNYPPLANFEDVAETTRDGVNNLINKTIAPDQDGDNVSYKWTLLYKDKSYSLGSTKNPQFTIKSYGLGKAAVGDWQVQLEANDPLGASSVLTKTFTVVNQKPIAKITGSPPFAYIDETYSFTSSDGDPDSEDKSSLTPYWRLTSPSGKVQMFYQVNLSSITFDEKGTHMMEHWAKDQLGAESEMEKVSFNVLNKRPIADFTRSPITTYRDVEIDFKSLATDYDGYIDVYRYELLRDGNTPLTLSTDAEFKRSFSSIGTFDIQHTVTDNDGATDSIVKKIYIVNRAPRAEVIEPSGASAAAATEYNSLTPTIRWTMSDADGDNQAQYQLQLKAENGTVLRTTAITTTANQSFTLPASWISEGTKYRVSVRAYDGYEWSEYAADKYFFVALNRPPVAGITFTPTVLFEGDALHIRHKVSDPDQDTLNVQYEVTAPNGQKHIYPNASSSYRLSSSQYSSSAFTMNRLISGTYTLKQTVDDGKSVPVQLIKMYRVAPLGITGQVSHTEQWESKREAYNAELGTNYDQYWQAQQFYSGERFMLTADTTLAGIKSDDETYAVEVTATLETTGTKVKLSYENNNRWSGSMWHESFNELSNGKHTFTFIVHYSNGTRKSHEIQIEIIGKAAQLAGVQRWK